MEIKTSKEIGFCFGVRRAMDLVEKNIGKMKKPIRIYGHLAHNEEVVKKIENLGIKTVNSLKEIKEGTLIITAHGISPLIKEELLNRDGLVVFDTTCPMVSVVYESVKKLKKESREILIFGDSFHQEVKGIKGAAGDKCQVFSSKNDFLKTTLDENKKYGLVSQTTQNLKELEEVKKIAEEKNIKVIDTVCQVTKNRQKEAENIAKESDVVLIIGSKKSANTNRLFKICFKFNKNSYFIEDENEIKEKWLKNKEKVGITAGASTPYLTVKKVIEKLNE